MNLAVSSVVQGMSMQSAYPPAIFEDEDGVIVRPTVQAIVCCDDMIAMVKPTAVADRDWWIPPQEGIDPSDTSPSATLERGLLGELGIVLSDASLGTAQILGSYLNPIPCSRIDGCARMTKRIIIVAVKVPDDVQVKLDPKEYSDFIWVSSRDELDVMMAKVAEERVRKYVYFCRALIAACMRGFLPSWWHSPSTGQMSLFAAR